jgi:HEAT repeat protein
MLISLVFAKTLFAGGVANEENKPTTYLDYTVFPEEKLDAIEANLINGLNSGNHGLRVSSAFYLGEMKSDRAIIPLLKLLRDGETNEAKIIAALSLYKIDSSIGMYRLKWLSQNEENEKLRANYERIYKAHLAKKS